MKEIIIAGAGPAGLTAATLLARAGKQVLLLDSREPGRHKVGECVPGAISRLLSKLNFPPIHAEEGLHRGIGGVISLWAGNLRSEDHFSKPEGGGWRLNRGEFEKSLASTALAAGVIRQPAAVRSISRFGGRWRIETDGGDILTADFVIDATGRNAVLARQLGAKRIHGPPLVAVWAVGSPFSSPGSKRTLIESTPDGWWYGAYLPRNRPLAIFHTTPRLASELRSNPSQWRKLLQATEQLSPMINADAFLGAELHASDARSSHLDLPCGPGWAACGDAALSFDPLSSQGIFNAIASGDMIASALRDPATCSLDGYKETLMEVRNIYARRRELLYESAASHFGSPFWRGQLAPKVPIVGGALHPP